MPSSTDPTISTQRRWRCQDPKYLCTKNPRSGAHGPPKTVNSWYLSPALHHYLCYHVYISETRGERIANTVVWFTTKGRTPTSSSTDLATEEARDLLAALRSPHPSYQISPLSDSKVSALKIMAEIFKTTFEGARDHKDDKPLPDMPHMALPGDNQSEKKLPAAEPRVLKLPSQPHPAPEPRVENPPKTSPKITYDAATQIETRRGGET